MIGSFRLTDSSLWSLADNLPKAFIIAKLLIFESFECKENNKKYLESLVTNTYKLCEEDVIKFCLLLKFRKGLTKQKYKKK